MSSIRSILSFIRWRIIAVRYLTMPFKFDKSYFKKRKKNTSLQALEMEQEGYVIGKQLPQNVLKSIEEIILPRIENSKSSKKHPFINLLKKEDISKENPIMRLVFSKDILDLAHNYFGGLYMLYSIQVLYSFEHKGKLKESQLWHKDFGDTKTLHSIFYLNEIKNEDGGPFVFVNKKDSKNIRWSPFVRRIKDEKFAKELRGGKIIKAFGPAGHNINVDPAVCYHCGSRCKIPRLALFVSFNTETPFVGPVDFIEKNKQKLINVASEIRPDLGEEYFKNIIK